MSFEAFRQWRQALSRQWRFSRDLSLLHIPSRNSARGPDRCTSRATSTSTTTTKLSWTHDVSPPIRQQRLASVSSQYYHYQRRHIYNNPQQGTHAFFDGIRVDNLRSVHKLADAVTELELRGLGHLTKPDHQRLIKPLLYACERLSFHDSTTVACLAERILLNCVAQLPNNIRDRHEKRDELVIPDVEDYNIALLTCSMQRSYTAGENAKQIFRLMAAEYREASRFLEIQNARKKLPVSQISSVVAPAPNMETHKFLCRTFALSGTWEGALEAESILCQYEQHCGLSTLNGSGRSADQLDQMLTLALPDLEFYSQCLGAYSKDGLKNPRQALERAKILFAHMQTLRHIELDWFSYYALMKCYRNVFRAGLATPEMTNEIESVLHDLYLVDVPRREKDRLALDSRFAHSLAYGILVNFYLLGDHPSEANVQKAHDLVLAMTGEYPQSKTFARLSDENWPDQDTIINVYRAWEKSSFANKDERIRQLRAIATTTNYHRDVACDKNMVLWAESGLAATPFILQEKLDHLLRNDVVPRPKIYGHAMEAWLNSSLPEASYHNEELLRHMTEHWSHVNNSFVAMVMKAWLRHCKDGERHVGFYGDLLAAEHVTLHLVNRKKDKQGRWHNSLCEIALEAWANQKPPLDNPMLCVEESTKLLSEIESQFSINRKGTPAQMYISVLQCCANVPADLPPSDKEKVMEIAFRLDSVVGRNDLSNVLFLQVAQSCRRNEPSTLMHTFTRARKTGFMTQKLIWQVGQTATKETLQSAFLLSEKDASTIVEKRGDDLCKNLPKSLLGKLDLSNLPQNWCRSWEDVEKNQGDSTK